MGEPARRARVVALTGVGVRTPLGSSERELVAAIDAGRDGFRPVGARVGAEALRGCVASIFAPEPWGARLVLPPEDEGEGDDPVVALAIEAGRDGWQSARLDARAADPARVAVVVGTSAGGLLSRARYEWTPPAERERRYRLLRRSDPGLVTRALAAAVGARGPLVTISTACTSSTHALVHGRDLLLAGLCDVALVGGAEALVEEVLAGFHAMGAMSPQPCAPFSLPVGMSVGEGAGFVVLERLEDAMARRAPIRARLVGGALSSDGWHRTAPDPTGAGLAQAMAAALADAGVGAAQVGYVNAHGSGTEANDAAEWRAIERVLGEAAAGVPVSSTKSYLGHTLGAAGVLELIVTVLCRERGAIPPTLHFAGPRGPGPIDPVAESSPRPHRFEVALKSSAGFGGTNAALVLAAAEPPGAEPAAAGGSTSSAPDAPGGVDRASASAGEPVWVLAAAAVGPFGWQDFDAALRSDVPLWRPLESGAVRRWAATVPAIPWARLARGVDLRGMPRAALLLLGAASLALERAGVPRRGPARERTGLFVGAWRPCWEVTRTFWGSLRDRGFDRASAPAFGHLVLNAVAGLVSTGLGLRGPLSVVAGRGATSLASLVLGREALGCRRDGDLLVVGSSAELSEEALEYQAAFCPDEPVAHRPFAVYGDGAGASVLGEGAGALVIAAERARSALDVSPVALLAGVGAAGPGRLDHALGAAMAKAGWAPADVDAVYGTADGRRESAERELAALGRLLGAHLARIPICNPASRLGASSALDALALCAAVEALGAGRAHPSELERSHAVAAGGPLGRAALHPTTRRVLVGGEDDAGGCWAVALGAVDGAGAAPNGQTGRRSDRSVAPPSARRPA